MSTIFVQIASYRDQQLIPTIRDLLQNAAHPENITFGICWQHDETESLDEFKNDTRFRIMDVPHQDSKGCCWARNLTQTLYAGETYTLQIDSHMRFIPNWDQECVLMMEDLKSRGYSKPILTGYPPSFFPEHDPEKRMNFPIHVKFDNFYEQGAVNLTPELLEGWSKMTTPAVAKYFSAGFCFADGSFVQDVPYDPNLFFRGEEITMTIRAYTHGYDFFHPHKIILWHEYTRPKAPKNHNAALMNQAHHRTNVFLGLSGENRDSIDFRPYGLGTARTFADYETFAGINFKAMDASKCIMMENLHGKVPTPKDLPTGLLLHVGCDTRKLKHFTNVDVRQTTATDVVSNYWSIAGIKNNSVAFIYSRHAVEHVSQSNARLTFAHWHDLLKPGGMINVIVPDMEFHARQILGLEKSSFADQMQHACASIWGRQSNQQENTQTDNHLWGYTFETLKRELSKAGFINIERFTQGDDGEPWHLNITAKKENKMKKVSCVMTTYRRFSCVERSIAMFLAQDYHNKELIIYNTDAEHPLSLDASFANHQHLIKIINNNIDMETKKPYTGVGAIRRDARLFADGEYFITWDDDDVFFPWNITQCVHGVEKHNKLAWKPLHSMMKTLNAAPEIKYNYFEASVIASMHAVEQHGYNLDKTGGEHMKWFKAIQKQGEMVEDADAVPGYCFYWSDPPAVAGHKQSNLAEYNRDDNFIRHKLMTTDHAKRAFKLTNFMKDYPHMWGEFRDVFAELQRSKPELFDRYISKFTQEVFSQKC